LQAASCKLQAASCKLQASVGWMSLFTSTVTPLVGSVKPDPTYSCRAFFLATYGLQLEAAFPAFT
ncbi:hypothetical protein, partial [Pseudomonas lopnurensis]|uniref:hypothetical protein n=1 Tax=Pseudomonas lopnurensis TaxID=1477517 RepID=UPI0028B24D08